MRVVTWNMGCGFAGDGYWPTHEEAWRYLRDELRADVMLVQEASLAVLRAMAPERVYAVPVSAAAHTGTAVVCARGVLAPIAELQGSSTLAMARCSVDDETLDVVSAHVIVGDKQTSDLAAIAPWVRDHIGERPCVVGGDFNAARSVGNAGFFDAMQHAGWVDLHWSRYGREVPSFWRKGVTRQIQDDHLFADAKTAERMGTCVVVDNDAVRRLSDHGPVVVDLRRP